MATFFQGAADCLLGVPEGRLRSKGLYIGLVGEGSQLLGVFKVALDLLEALALATHPKTSTLSPTP